ncbi:hypothetical protein DFO56_10516 [Kosakonia sp. AG348]|nr:hypothetical protein DFO56_10516 [Kosakonia sp. AG348]
MSMKEPVIDAGTMSNEELHSWFMRKAENLNLLRELEIERESLEARLAALSARIAQVSLESQLEIFAKD